MNLVRVDQAVSDSRINTMDEIYRTRAFLRDGSLIPTQLQTKEQLEQQLHGIGYIKENHHNYTFYFFKRINPSYGNDHRHIFIEELQDWFSYI